MITYIFELFRTPFPHKKETLTVTAFFSLLVYVYIFIEWENLFFLFNPPWLASLLK